VTTLVIEGPLAQELQEFGARQVASGFYCSNSKTQAVIQGRTVFVKIVLTQCMEFKKPSKEANWVVEEIANFLLSPSE